MTFGKNVERFLVWLSSDLSKQKNPTAEIIEAYILSEQSLRCWALCIDKFEDNQSEKVFNMFSECHS